LTHILHDSLEADAKVLLLCCVSSDASNLSDTIGTLCFGSRMQKVFIGKATKHIAGSKEVWTNSVLCTEVVGFNWHLNSQS
jgi:hypothetical protein